MATGQTQSFGPWTARSHGLTRSACSSDRGIHPEAADALHEQQAKAPEPSPEKMTMTRSKTSPPDFMLASGKNGSGVELRHDPRAQRDRMNLFKRQLAANRTRGTEEVMKRNRAQTLQQKASGGASDHPSKDSFVTRSVVDALRDERGAVGKGREGEAVTTTLTGLGGEGKGTQLPIAAEDWPFVYFVVALDQMPVVSEDMADLKVGKPHTARERQRVQAARKRRIQQSREELERIRESNIDMGLRLEPIWPATRTPHTPHTHHTTTPAGQDQARQRMNASKHPPTPISSESLQDFPMHRGTDYFLNNGEQLSMEDMMCRGFSQWFSDNFSTASNSQPGSRPGGEIAVEGSAVGKTEKPEEPSPGQNASGASSVQLPDIAQEQGGKKKGNAKPKDHHGKAQPTSNGPPESGQAADPNKKVHFAEGLPYIKGSGLQLPQSKQEPDSASRPLTTPYVSKTAGGEGFAESFPDMLQPPWSAPVMSRSLPAMTPKSKNCRPLPMPKIDIVSEIYDELIVKTIQSFLAREGYSEAKFANLRKKIMARLSATYPHLAAHRAWKMSHRESGIHPEGQGPLPTETDERSRLRLRPLHQGFFAKDPKLDIASGDFVRETSLLGDLTFPPHSGRQMSDFVRPRWVPVMPMYRSYSSLRPEDEEAYSRGAFMAIDGCHIVFTPREDLPFKTATLPGATSDFRMGPLTLPDDSRPAKTWTHIIPSAIDE